MGGHINGSLGNGNGSEFEFLVEDTRFIVVASHGSRDHTMIAQMKFMCDGLERSGVTLDSINALYGKSSQPKP